MFERIIVALDGSESAAEALTVAVQLAKAEQAALGICSVVDPIAITGTAPPSPAMEIVVRDMEKEARRLVDEAVAGAKHAGLTAAGNVRSGAPAFELLAYATEFNAGLIVMGTHGRRGIAHFLMGSVAEEILRESSVPVLVVRERRDGQRTTSSASATPAAASDPSMAAGSAP
ncbi:MAG TPA: universal stress protein [Candidatus Binatia bacterium]|nr:universal stress protein [Candidatus Binatia bacterium]